MRKRTPRAYIMEDAYSGENMNHEWTPIDANNKEEGEQ